MGLDDIHDIDDWSQITVWALIDRIQRSDTEEQLIYRETELDELWRLLDIASASATRDGAAHAPELLRMKQTVMQVHDLVGVEHKPAEAADLLKSICPA